MGSPLPNRTSFVVPSNHSRCYGNSGLASLGVWYVPVWHVWTPKGVVVCLATRTQCRFACSTHVWCLKRYVVAHWHVSLCGSVAKPLSVPEHNRGGGAVDTKTSAFLQCVERFLWKKKRAQGQRKHKSRALLKAGWWQSLLFSAQNVKTGHVQRTNEPKQKVDTPDESTKVLIGKDLNPSLSPSLL